MKYYPDGVAEGTPEEIAAFKHIDAALAARGKRAQLAIEGPKKAAKKAAPKKAATPRKPQTEQRLTDEMADQIVALALAKDGINAHDVAQYLEMDSKTAYNKLYRLRQKGLLWLTGEGVFKAEKDAVGQQQRGELG